MKSTILSAICCMLMFCACHDEKEQWPRETGRAVLVYMAADNNLDNEVRNDLSEMIEGSKMLGDEAKLIALVDRRRERPYILEIANGDTIRRETFDEELSTSSAETLRTAMRWLTDHYQAKSYGLVLWGHADGWIIYDEQPKQEARRRGYGIDYTAGSTWMNITDMARVLGDFPRLTFIFADCCAFMSVESMYELRGVADYIIGSPAEIPAEGAPYQTVVPQLFNEDERFYERIADAYFAQVTYDKCREPLSVVKTSEMERLAAATREVLASFVPTLPDSRYPDVGGLIYYYKHTLYDMNDVIMAHAAPDNYTTWREALDAAVVYKTFTDHWRARFVAFMDFYVTEQRYGGLNMYVPQDASYLPMKYVDTALRQDATIHLMQWYQAAGYRELGW